MDLNFEVFTPGAARQRNEPLPAGTRSTLLNHTVDGVKLPDILKSGKSINVSGLAESMADTVRDVFLAAGVPIVQVVTDSRKPGLLRVYPFIARKGAPRKNS